MRILIPVLSILVLSHLSACDNGVIESRDIPFLNSTIHLSTLDEAKNLLGTSDEFTQSQSPFDYASKTQNANKTAEIDYLNFAKSNAKEWTAKDIKKTTQIILEADKKIRELGLKIPLPKSISLINSACGEEGGAAGYTRGDFIVVNGVPDEHLFLHELFHIISRHDPVLRNALYETISFYPCKRIEYPSSLISTKITNPDAPFFDNYIQVEISGQQEDVVIITQANRPYEGGSFFQYLNLQLLALEGDADMKSAKSINGNPVLFDFAQAASITNKIGTNTGYNIHPEEILAEHFTMLVTSQDVAEPKYIDAIRTILRK